MQASVCAQCKGSAKEPQGLVRMCTEGLTNCDPLICVRSEDISSGAHCTRTFDVTEAMSAREFQVGDLVWLERHNACPLAARVHRMSAKTDCPHAVHSVVTDRDQSDVITLTSSCKLTRRHVDDVDGIEDLTRLKEHTPAAILHTVVDRANHNENLTAIGDVSVYCHGDSEWCERNIFCF